MTPAPMHATVSTASGVTPSTGSDTGGRLQTEHPAGRIRCGHLRAEVLHDVHRALDELPVRRLHAALEVQVVLQPDPDVAAEQHRLGHPGQLVAADGEGGPLRVPGQQVHHRLQQLGLGWGTVRDTHAQLEQRRRVDQPLGDHLLGEPQVAGIEDLQLRFHPELLDALRADPQHVRGGDVELAALAEVQRAAVQGADVRQQLLDVRQPVQPVDQVGSVHRLERVLLVDHQVATHPGGQVDHHVDAAVLDPPDHLPVQRDLPGWAAGLDVPDVDVHHRRAGVGRLDRRGGDLLRGDRYELAAPDGVAGAGERTGNDHFTVHPDPLMTV